MKGLVRNLEKAKEALSSPGGGGDDLEIELEQGDILDETSLGAAMKVRNTSTYIHGLVAVRQPGRAWQTRFALRVRVSRTA